MILNDLKEAIDRNVSIRILTGSYLNITSPTALYMLKRELNDKVDLRFYNVHNKSFHPKSYIFHNENDSEIYIGSSNLSCALTDSIEWNYRFLRSKNPNDFEEYYSTFEDLFNNHSEIIDDEVMKQYSKSWKRPRIYKDIDKANRILFVAHREEIIKQAAVSFNNVRKSDDIGFFYNNAKDNDKSMIFALVQTLGKDEYLKEEYFKKDYFDYIIIDDAVIIGLN